MLKALFRRHPKVVGITGVTIGLIFLEECLRRLWNSNKTKTVDMIKDIKPKTKTFSEKIGRDLRICFVGMTNSGKSSTLNTTCAVLSNPEKPVVLALSPEYTGSWGTSREMILHAEDGIALIDKRGWETMPDEKAIIDSCRGCDAVLFTLRTSKLNVMDPSSCRKFGQIYRSAIRSSEIDDYHAILLTEWKGIHKFPKCERCLEEFFIGAEIAPTSPSIFKIENRNIDEQHVLSREESLYRAYLLQDATLKAIQNANEKERRQKKEQRE